MEIKVTEKTDTVLQFELLGAGHTFCNALKDALTEQEEIVVATYTISHPMVAEPEFYIEAESSNFSDYLAQAVETLRERNESFSSSIASLDM